MEKPLRLRLLRRRGISVGSVHIVARNSCFSTHSQDGLSIDREPSLDETVLHLVRHGQEWWLINRDQDVRCTVNSEIVPLYRQIRLSEGDVIEWGLLLWSVLSDDEPEHEPVREPSEPLSAIDSAVEGTVTGPSALSSLDLTWFDRRAHVSKNEADPFDLIMPVREHVAVDTEAAPSQPAIQAKNDMNFPEPDNVLRQLGKEYHRALYEPQIQTMPDPWLINPGMAVTTNAPIDYQEERLADLARESNPLATLQDLVAGPLHIDDIFHGLDSLRETDLFTEEKPEDILRLFATGLAKESSSDLISTPVLTRREHHAMTVDSHYYASQHGADIMSNLQEANDDGQQ